MGEVNKNFDFEFFSLFDKIVSYNYLVRDTIDSPSSNSPTDQELVNSSANTSDNDILVDGNINLESSDVRVSSESANACSSINFDDLSQPFQTPPELISFQKTMRTSLFDLNGFHYMIGFNMTQKQTELFVSLNVYETLDNIDVRSLSMRATTIH